MPDSHWWSRMEEKRRNDLRDFDERSRASLLLAIRDAFLLLVLVLLPGSILAGALLPTSSVLRLLFDSSLSPLVAFLAASLVGLLSWILRGGVSWRLLLWMLPLFLLSGMLVAFASQIHQNAGLPGLRFSVYSLILMGLGLLGLGIALARWQRWPLPRVLQGPTAQPQANAGRVAALAALLILLAFLVR